VPREVVQACVDDGEVERPYDRKHRYVAFVDPSGGSSDSMTLAIGHREKEITVVDVVREIVAPFDPESATEEFAGTLKGYNITRVTGDRYAGEAAELRKTFNHVHRERAAEIRAVCRFPAEAQFKNDSPSR
jgi:hypothetical protein